MPFLWLCQAPGAHAHTVSARIAQIQSSGVTLHEVNIRLDWPEDVAEGMLSVKIARAEVDMLAEPFLQLNWQCPLRRGQGWRCDGPVRSGTQPPLRLALDLSDAVIEVQLADDAAALYLRRDAAAPDLVRIDLHKVPLTWLQSWLAQLWPQVRLGEGQLDGEVRVWTPDAAPLRVETAFTLSNGALETNTGQIAAAGVGLRADVMVSIGEDAQSIAANATLNGAEALIGSAYLELPQTPLTLEISACARRARIQRRFGTGQFEAAPSQR